jgi:hypothetical protein
MRRLDEITSPEVMQQELSAHGYIADQGLATALYIAMKLPQPLLLEGEAGVGKTEAAKTLADILQTPLLRLQCYEGIDASEALYEWNYPRQLLGIRVAEAERSHSPKSHSSRAIIYLSARSFALSNTKAQHRLSYLSTKSIARMKNLKHSC